MKVVLTLEAIDRASRVINAVGGSFEKLASLQDRINRAKDAARTDFVDKAAGFAAFVAPLMKANKVFADFEDKLTDVGLKGELSGAKLKAFGEEIITLSPKLNRTASQLLEGVDKLVAGGMKFDDARKSIEAITKASVATKAPIEVLSDASTTLINNMGVATKDLPKALDIMAQIGKDGKFELENMAKAFPDIGARFSEVFGQKGLKAVADLGAALSIVADVAGPGQQSMVATRDMLNKITSNKAVKAFEEAGMDIKALMKAGMESGRVFETVYEALKKVTGGDVNKIGDIYQDSEAQKAAIAFLSKFEEFEKRRNKALGASGVVEADFLTRLGLQAEKMQALTVAMDSFWLALGQSVAPAVTLIVTQLTEWIKALTVLIQTHPELTKWLIAGAVAVAGLFAALALLKLGALIALSGLSALARAVMIVLAPLRLLWVVLLGVGQGIAAGVAAVGGWGAVMAGIAARFAGLGRLLAGPFAMAGRAVMGLGAALLATPAGWVIGAIAAIAGAVYLIYQNWGAIGPWLADLWATIKAGAGAAWNGFVAWVASLGASIAEAFSSAWTGVTTAAASAWNGVVDALKSGWSTATAAIGDMFDGLIAPLKSAWDKVVSWFEKLKWPELPKFEIFDKIGAAFDTFVSRLETGWNKLADLFKSIKMPTISMPSWLRGVVGGGPGEEEVKATDASAKAARASVEAIGPAAQTAMATATAAVSSVSFYSQGVAMMETLAAGIRAGSASAVSAVASTVQKIRDHLPHSPAKTGPLSDLDRVQFSETLAGAISAGAPRAIAAARAVAAGLAAAVPIATAPAYGMASGEGLANSRATTNAGAIVSVSAPVTIQISVTGSNPQEVVAALRSSAYEITDIIEGEIRRRMRVTH